MQITKLSQQLKTPSRVNVFADGKFYRGLDKLVAMKLGLKVGLVLTPELIDRLEHHQSSNQALNYALNSLQRSPKSLAQLRSKLKTRFADDLVELTLKRLLDNQLLSDEKLANDLILKYTHQAKSERQIYALLKSKGLPPTIIKTRLQSRDTAHEELAALKVIKRKFAQIGAKGDWAITKTKLVNHLAQRGFNYGVIKAVVKPENLVSDTEHIA